MQKNSFLTRRYTRQRVEEGKWNDKAIQRELSGMYALHDFNFLIFHLLSRMQIIIEAISGLTRLSDIAFDDISILTDQDCTDSNEDDDRKEPEDADEAYEVESCVNRCFENATVQLYVNKTLSCSCSIDCSSSESCCPDFIGKKKEFNYF